MKDPSELYTPRGPVTLEDIQRILDLGTVDIESIASWSRRSVSEIRQIRDEM